MFTVNWEDILYESNEFTFHFKDIAIERNINCTFSYLNPNSLEKLSINNWADVLYSPSNPQLRA